MDKECSLAVLLLHNSSPEHFGECLCQTGCIVFTGVYVFIRDIFAISHFAMLLWDAMMIILEPKDRVYVFFDFWNQALLFFTTEVAVYSVVARWAEADLDENCCWDYTPWFSKLLWALYSAVVPSTILSTIVFWSFRYKSCTHKGHLIGLKLPLRRLFVSEAVALGVSGVRGVRGRARAVGIVMACVSPVAIILDFALIAFPLRLMHMFYFIIWYWLYVVMTAVFQNLGLSKVGQTVPVYTVLDWRNPKEAVLNAFIGLLIGVVLYIVFWVISKLKGSFRHPCPLE